MKKLDGVCSEGGPMLVLPSELASHRRGVLAPIDADVPPGWTWDDGGVVCDYECALDAVNEGPRTPVESKFDRTH